MKTFSSSPNPKPSPCQTVWPSRWEVGQQPGLQHAEPLAGISVRVDAAELVELMEFAGHGAWALGWRDLADGLDLRQRALLRRLRPGVYPAPK